ncbi:transketolase-like protein [Arthrobacter sp. SLBN-100]|nr:transketolase-like protein [Arthrobacter sp. SLBN-100]
MNADFQDGLFDEALVERVERPEDGIVETGAGLNKRFKAFEPDAVMLVPPSLDEWLPQKPSQSHRRSPRTIRRRTGGDTPIAEASIIGSSVGLAASGMVPVAELQFLGFGHLAFHQVAHQRARLRFRSQGRLTAPVTIRAPFGVACVRWRSTAMPTSRCMQTSPGSRSSLQLRRTTPRACFSLPSGTRTPCSSSSRYAASVPWWSEL